MTATTHQLRHYLTVAVLLLAAVAGAFGGAAGAPTSQPADLAVSQPDYINQDVREQVKNGTNVYIVNAQQVELQPQNFDSENVVGYGVEQSAGELTYDDRMDEWRFNAQNQTGSFTVYFEVEQAQAVMVNNTTTTQQVRTRYSAIIRVDSNTTYQHVPAGSLQDQRRKADNWDEWTSSLESIWGSDVDIGAKTQWSVNINDAVAHPWKAFSGQFSALVVSMFITLGGMLLATLIVILHLLSRWTDIKWINRFNTLRAEEKEVDEKLSDLRWAEKEAKLQKMDWNDIFDNDRVARAFRDAFGETAYRGVLKLGLLTSPKALIHDRVQAMGAEGYAARVTRRDISPDGGDGAGDERRITDVELVYPDDVDDRKAADADNDDVEYDDLSAPSDELLEALDWSADNDILRSYDLSSSIFDPDTISHLEQSYEHMTLEELMVELNAQAQDFEDPGDFGLYFREFIESVRSHPFTDEYGGVNETRHAMSLFLDLAEFLDDCEGVPVFEFWADAIDRELTDRSPVREASDVVEGIKSGRDI